MANIIPFEKLEVGKTYLMQSCYWHEVLGHATIERFDISTGRGSVFTDWNPNSEDGRGWCMIDANEDIFWDAMPTKDEQLNAQLSRKTYVPPRIFDGVMYDGKILSKEWIEKLDELSSNLKKTFENDTRFKAGRNGTSFIWASKLNYAITPFLVRGNGRNDNESIKYLMKKTGFKIHAGERDCFGWLTGVIDCGNKSIIYD